MQSSDTAEVSVSVALCVCKLKKLVLQQQQKTSPSAMTLRLGQLLMDDNLPSEMRHIHYTLQLLTANI